MAAIMNPFKPRLAVSACCLAVCISGGRAVGGEMTPTDQKTRSPAKDWDLFEEARQAISEYLGPDEILIPPGILEKAELGDHFETINPDRPDTHNAFGNPDSHVFTRVSGNDSTEAEGGTFGQRNGGGRRLMAPKRSGDLSNAIMKCMREGLSKDVPPPALNDAQSKELAKAVRALGADDYQERERGSKAIMDLGAACITTLEETLKTDRDAEVTARIKKLMPRLKLLAVLAKFRADHPLNESGKDEKAKTEDAGKANIGK
jgi:hypothetical protein